MGRGNVSKSWNITKYGELKEWHNVQNRQQSFPKTGQASESEAKMLRIDGGDKARKKENLSSTLLLFEQDCFIVKARRPNNTRGPGCRGNVVRQERKLSLRKLYVGNNHQDSLQWIIVIFSSSFSKQLENGQKCVFFFEAKVFHKAVPKYTLTTRVNLNLELKRKRDREREAQQSGNNGADVAWRALKSC